MGRFYDMFYKREPVQDVVHVTLPPGFATPQGYGALMSIDFAACEQTKARSMASLPVREEASRSLKRCAAAA